MKVLTALRDSRDVMAASAIEEMERKTYPINLKQSIDSLITRCKACQQAGLWLNDLYLRAIL